jgi:hypothetical protein
MLARLFATISVAALLLAVTMISASDAGFRRLRSSYVPGEVITAQSHHGNGIISSVVRPARYGCRAALGLIAGAVVKRHCVSKRSISPPTTITPLRATGRCRANAASSAASAGDTLSNPVRV